MDKIYIAEYCYQQKQFHIGKLIDCIVSNKEMVVRIIKTEKNKENAKIGYYVPFMIGTYEQCSEAIDKMRKLRNNNE